MALVKGMHTVAAHSGATIRIAVLAMMLLLGACASNPPAPVDERSFGESDAPSPPAAIEERNDDRGYVVRSGDTLYGIAFKNGLDYRDIARWNGIGAPYRILVGQHLRLQGDAVVAQVDTSDAPSEPSLAEELAAEERHRPGDAPKSTKSSAPVHRDAPIVAVASSKPPLAKAEAEKNERTDILPVAVAKNETDNSPKNTAPAEPLKPVVAATTGAPVVTPPTPVPSSSNPPAMPPSASLSSAGVSWRWPAAGKVVGTYVAGDQTRQGVDVAGKAGDAVVAAADGTVVYSGNGLIGYGELIIVKHNASFLSAYGHNRKRLVKEGETVKAGQAIAEMGSSASSREGLHFEIRKNGKPINPLDFLPAK
jgi:lipoprotein NlpD